MRRNGYLWIFGVNLDTAVRFADPDFLLQCKISAIWRSFPLIFAFYMLNVRHAECPGRLTYWPRKYTTRVDPHVDNSRQFEVDMTIHCRVFRFCLPTCHVTLWPWPSIFWPWTYVMHGESRDQHCHQVWRPRGPRLSVLELWVITFPVGYHWKCVRGYCACAESRDPWVGGQNNYIFCMLDPDLPIHYASSVALRWK